MAKKENKFFSEIKNQIIAGVGLVIAAGFGIFITNMEAWFSPKEKSTPIMEQTINPPNNVKDTLVITKTIVVPPVKEVEKKEDEITW